MAKLDAPTWGKAAATVASAAAEAAQMAEMTAACDEGDEVAFDNLSREEEAKRAWLSKMDVPTWGAAAAAVSAVASEASAGSASSAQEIAIRMYAQMALEFDAPLNVFATPARKIAALAVGGSQEVAKQAWLEKLDAPTWSKAAAALARVASDAAQMADMTAAYDRGDQLASDHVSHFSQEEEAKRAWMAKLDVPTWGQAAAAVSAVAEAAQITEMTA